MKRETIDRLLEEYRNMKCRNSNTCMKFLFKYNSVSVNLFYDAYDEDAVALSMVLSKDNQYYYTSLSIINNDRRSEFLHKIPPSILESIKDSDSKLKSFFEKVEEHLLVDGYRKINYKEDRFFVNTIKYAQKGENRKDLPFLSGIRKRRMQDSTLWNLYETQNIPMNVLKGFQKAGITLVRTDNPERRKSLKIILEEAGIEYEKDN